MSLRVKCSAVKNALEVLFPSESCNLALQVEMSYSEGPYVGDRITALISIKKTSRAQLIVSVLPNLCYVWRVYFELCYIKPQLVTELPAVMK